MGRSIFIVVAILANLFALTACEYSVAEETDGIPPSQAGWYKFKNSWIGATETELVKQLGAPENIYEADDGTRVLTYSIEFNCKLSATTFNKRITDLRRRGSGCY